MMSKDEAIALDLRGLKCPLPVLKLTKALKTMDAGATVVVEATDPLARIDIPHFCNEHGHQMVEADVAGEILRFVIMVQR